MKIEKISCLKSSGKLLEFNVNFAYPETGSCEMK